MRQRLISKTLSVLISLVTLPFSPACSQQPTSAPPSAQATQSTGVPVPAPKTTADAPPKLELKETVPDNSGSVSTSGANSASLSSRPKGFAISYLESDRKWQLGFRHEPYNKISGYLQEQLVKELSRKEIEETPKVDGNCCWIKIELLQVSTRQAVIKKPGIDVAANVTVTDARNRVVYAKGYSGKSGTGFVNTWGHLIDHACEDAGKNMAADENLLSVLRTGKLD